MKSSAALADIEAARRAGGQFGTQVHAYPGTDVIGDVETGMFSKKAVDDLHVRYQNSTSGLERALVSEQISMVRTRRLADLVADHYPDATGVRVTDLDGGPAQWPTGILLADGSTVTDRDAENLFIDMGSETFDLYTSTSGWRATATDVGQSAWVIDVAKARSIDDVDVAGGRFDPDRFRLPHAFLV